MENLRVLEGSEVFFRGLQHLYPRFKSGWHLLKPSDNESYLRYFFAIFYEQGALRIGKFNLSNSFKL